MSKEVLAAVNHGLVAKFVMTKFVGSREPLAGQRVISIDDYPCDAAFSDERCANFRRHWTKGQNESSGSDYIKDVDW